MPIPSIAGHPKGMAVCLLTELWERFSYYGMRALLIFYLTQHLLYGDDDAYLIYGGYTALVYMTPVVGGAIADRYLGARKAVILGGVLLVLGHFGLAFEGGEPVASFVRGVTVVKRNPAVLAVFYLSLSLIVVGVGFLKSNISATVGRLYSIDDPRREAGFTYFYWGYNLGGALAPILCGWLGQTYGWRYGFGLAGIGMLAGLIVFLRGQKYLDGCVEPPNPETLAAPLRFGLNRERLIYLGALGMVIAAWFAMMHPWLIGQGVALLGSASICFVLWYLFRRCEGRERDRLWVCLVLILFSIGFWAFYEQLGSSLNIFADRVVDRSIGSWTVPASALQSLPAIFVLLLGPFFGMLWTALAEHRRDPGIPIKFVSGIAALSLAFVVLALGAWSVQGDHRVSLIWLILNFFLLAVGEMCLAPIGISMVTRLTPSRIVGVMMGIFFLAYAGSSFLAGRLAQMTVSAGPAAGVERMAHDYAASYGVFAIVSAAVALLLLCLSPFLNARIRND